MLLILLSNLIKPGHEDERKVKTSLIC